MMWEWCRPASDIAHYGLALDLQVFQCGQRVAEAYADTPVSPREESACVVNGGLRWRLTSSLVLDTAVGAGLRGLTPDLMVSVGVTWTFDLPWRAKK